MSINLIIESFLRALEDADRVYDLIIERTGDLERAEETRNELRANAQTIYNERCKLYA